MTVKKIFAALLVPALSATLLSGAASAKYTCDTQTDVRTWTFPDSGRTTLNNKTYYLYDNSLTTTSDSSTLYTDKLLIYNDGSTSYKSSIFNTLYRCVSGSSISFKAPSNGTVSVSARTSSDIIRINDNQTTTAAVTEGATVKITVVAKNTTNYYSDITGITFTPTKENKTFTVDPITIGSDTTDAGVTFKADNDNYPDWNCSIWDTVKAFRGNVNFNVKMNNVPNTVSVSAESYVK